LLEVYDANPALLAKPWTPPVSAEVGWQGLSPEQLRAAAFQDTEPVLQLP
jgi:hypothetical protein